MDVEAEVLDAFCESIEEACGVELVEEVVSQFDIGGFVLEDMVDGHSHGVGDGDERFLLSLPWSYAAVLGTEVGAFLANGTGAVA